MEMLLTAIFITVFVMLWTLVSAIRKLVKMFRGDASESKEQEQTAEELLRAQIQLRLSNAHVIKHVTIQVSERMDIQITDGVAVWADINGGRYKFEDVRDWPGTRFTDAEQLALIILIQELRIVESRTPKALPAVETTHNMPLDGQFHVYQVYDEDGEAIFHTILEDRLSVQFGKHPEGHEKEGQIYIENVVVSASKQDHYIYNWVDEVDLLAFEEDCVQNAHFMGTIKVHVERVEARLRKYNDISNRVEVGEDGSILMSSPSRKRAEEIIKKRKEAEALAERQKAHKEALLQRQEQQAQALIKDANQDTTLTVGQVEAQAQAEVDQTVIPQA